MDILINNSDIDLDDACSWNLWKKVNNKFDLQHMNGSVDSLLTEIEERWSAFLLYTYCNWQQRDYIKELRVQSTEKTFVVAQIDFSMNYTLVRQREVQQGFFSRHQTALFTIHLTIGQEHRSLAIISDCMEHSTSFVYCAQRILVQFIKQKFPLAKKINYLKWISSIPQRESLTWGNVFINFLSFSDGASAHFKNNASIFNLTHHKADFGLDACWTFTDTGHGKGAGDGIGALLKSAARRVTLAKNILLSSPKDFYEFSREQQWAIFTSCLLATLQLNSGQKTLIHVTFSFSLTTFQQSLPYTLFSFIFFILLIFSSLFSFSSLSSRLFSSLLFLLLMMINSILSKR
jgi:hypothetical protein